MKTEFWSLVRVRLDRGGYTSNGQYFGVAGPLYALTDLDGKVYHFRSGDRKSAIAKAVKDYGAVIRGMAKFTGKQEGV